MSVNLLPMSVVDYLQKFAVETPEATAYIYKDTKLSYKKLYEKVEMFSRYLLERGVTEGSIVGVYMKRSIDMIVSILSIMNIQATYLPIDTTYPLDRTYYILSHAKVRFVITDEENNLEYNKAANIVYKECYETHSNINVRRKDYLAYIIYTSGTTGVPKGVKIGLFSLLNVLQAVGQKLGITTDDIILATTTISFDISILELLLCLLVGASCVIATEIERRDGELLNLLFDKHCITIMQATPTNYKLLMKTGWRGNERLKVLCGGEALDSNTVKYLLGICKELWNMYGPTETTIWSTMKKIVSEDMISIGSPISNTYIYICNDKMEQVVLGQIGELYIGGVGVSKGYLNDEQLTNEKFIESPFENYKGILFRTGDYVKKINDEEIIYIGRADEQIKYKGYRIDLKEIDNVFKTEQEVENITTILEKKDDYSYLHSFVKIKDNSVGDIDFIKDKLIKLAKLKLPQYMHPEKISFLNSVPITSNGKFDKNIFKKTNHREKYILSTEHFASSKEKSCTSNKNIKENIYEVMICHAASKIIGESVDEQMDLVDMGFDSLKIAELIAMLREQNCNIDFSMFENCSTIAEIAKKIKNNNCFVQKNFDKNQQLHKNIEDNAAKKRLQKLEMEYQVTKVVELSEYQQCMLKHTLLYKNSKAYNQVFTYTIKGSVDIDVCRKAFDELKNKCDLFYSVFLVGTDKSYRAVINTRLRDSLFVYKDISEDVGREVQEYLNIKYSFKYQTPFCLTLNKVSDKEYVFVWAYHHILFDGYSIERVNMLFWSEYENIYFNLNMNNNIDLTDKYIYWLKGQNLYEAKKFWSKEIAFLNENRIDTNKFRKRINIESSNEQEELYWTINDELSIAFSNKLKSLKVFFHAGMKAVWSVVLHNMFHRNIVTFGNVLSGRTTCLPEHRDLIGVMINVVPICVKFNGMETYRDVLIDSQKKHMQTMQYEFFPFKEIEGSVRTIYEVLDCIIIYNNSNFESQINSDILNSMGLNLEQLKIHDNINCGMCLYVTFNEQIHIQVSYNKKLYNSNEIIKMMQELERVMQFVINNIDSNIE